MLLIDTHCHLDQDEFAADRDEVIARAVAAGVTNMVAVGISAASSAATIEIARRSPAVCAAVGIQPNYVAQAAAGDWDRILELVRSDRVVAVGETGLDRYWDYSPFEMQQDYFDRHLRLAQSVSLPIIIHTRDCDQDALEMLRAARRQGPVAGVMHSFTGSAATAAECIQLGLFVSFAGMITYKKSIELRKVAETVPIERLLIETDSPYLSPVPQRGKRNEPAHLVHTANEMAEIKGATPFELARITTDNARQLFKLTGVPGAAGGA